MTYIHVYTSFNGAINRHLFKNKLSLTHPVGNIFTPRMKTASDKVPLLVTYIAPGAILNLPAL